MTTTDSLLSKASHFIPISDEMDRSIFTPSLKEGCYAITFKPYSRNYIYFGTMRVDKYANAISGDFYKFPDGIYDWRQADPLYTSDIPIYPRHYYYSYLKVTGISRLPAYSIREMILKLTIEEYEYIHPQEGYNGSFSTYPSRKIFLHLTKANFGSWSPIFEGTLTEGGIDQGEFWMGWVSPFYRRGALQISTTPGAIPPKPVRAGNGIRYENFRTIFSSAGWDLDVIYNPERIISPLGTTTLTGGSCPSEADLNTLLSSMNIPNSFLDNDWRLQLLVVPGRMGCSRGMIFNDNRIGVAVFSHDGYPKEDSENFGPVENKQQWQVPRAFIRSAAHEVGHGFNQQHQYLVQLGEPGSDNSIMTTTPEVADFLANPGGQPRGVFPKDIDLRFNAHVRRHLIHFPDPVVRPGGMDFQTGHSTNVPEAD